MLGQIKWNQTGALAICALSIFLGIGTSFFALTLLVGTVGILWILHPPQGGLPRLILFLTGAFICLPLTAFLPASLLPTVEWRMILTRDLKIFLPRTLSPQPWITFETFGITTATVAWCWHCLSVRVSTDQRKTLATCVTLLLTIPALTTLGRLWIASDASILLAVAQFANRNQTGDLLMLAGIMTFAMAMGAIPQKKQGRIFWGSACTLCFSAIVFNGSRAALVLFFLGIAGWLAWAQTSQKNKAWLGTGLATALLALSVFWLSNSDLLSRFAAPKGLTVGFRAKVFHDATDMILKAPFFGVGLGNFEGVFNTLRTDSGKISSRILHPESDWLWLGTEMGIPAVLLAASILLAIWFYYRPRAILAQSDDALAKACWVAGLMFLVHTFFDVGAHRLGTLWPAVYLTSLGLQRRKSSHNWHFRPMLARCIGTAFVFLALFRWQSVSSKAWIPTSRTVESLKAKASSPDTPDPIAELSAAAAITPLDWTIYFQRGALSLKRNHQIKAAAEDFRRVRYLEQSSYFVPQAEAELWRNVDPARMAASQWQVYLRGDDRKDALLREMLQDSQPEKEARALLLGYVRQNENALLTALLVVKEPEFSLLLAELLKQNPTLAGISSQNRKMLFLRWVEAGNLADFRARWLLNKAWQADGWFAYAKALSADNPAEAMNMAFLYMPRPAIPLFDPRGSAKEAHERHLRFPNDISIAVQWFQTLSEENQRNEGIPVLLRISALPGCPAYIFYLLGEDYHRKGNDAVAWRFMERYHDAAY